MISVEKAQQLISKNLKFLEDSTINIDDGLGFILSKDIISPINMPPFRQSAMDGYALNLSESNIYSLIGEIKAGDGHQPFLKKGEAVRIFTGAPVPDSANAVIMQESVMAKDNILTIEKPVKHNDNIRPLGEQVKKDAVALKKGTVLTPAAIGYLTSLGIIEVEVYHKPSIAILVTGNELIEAGQDLPYGKIYESNGQMLNSAVRSLGYQNVTNYKVADDYKNTVKLLDEIICKHDVVLVSGGISVGDYDFVGKALAELEVEQIFYKVKQKPGKPFFFGKKQSKMIFALPGNPAAALSCFYIYVYPTLKRISGDTDFILPRTIARSKSNFIKKGDRAQFLKAAYKNGTVQILEGQSSAMLHTFAYANALVYIPETGDSIKADDEVEVILLPIN